MFSRGLARLRCRGAARAAPGHRDCSLLHAVCRRLQAPAFRGGGRELGSRGCEGERSVGGGVLRLGQALCLHWGRGEGVEGGFQLGFLRVGQIPEYVTMLHPRSTHMHTRAHAHTCTHTERRPAGSRQRCSRRSRLQQLRSPAAPPRCVQRGSGRGWRHSRGDNSTRKEGKWCNPRPRSGPAPPFSPGVAEVTGSLGSGREAGSRQRAARTRGGEGNQGKGSRRTGRAGGLTLRSIFLLFGLGHLSTHRSQLA